MFEEFVLRALILTAICSGVPLACSSFFGLLIAFIQSAIQVQEQSFLFLVKLTVVTSLVIYGWGWAFEAFKQLVRDTFLGLSMFGAL
ncbi:MAG: hypothetical protein GYA55_07425 [SAR324 cluster bacterium]|uniref:EscS/YscS/HrcS family type III secretion system export apparatus protein n=1 Tax=SAR324 cluster bacterium TaxID=2024889 RepID=A0A7X9IKC5_9DELT|nr:hypothetical protein [SAR324 cluster bacterium]